MLHREGDGLNLPKEPALPPNLLAYADALTSAVFLDEIAPSPCDVLFVFGGTHPGHWQTALRAYRSGYAERIVVTGGVKPGVERHPDWTWGEVPEAHVIVRELLAGGVPEEAIAWEDQSRNSLENTLYARNVFDFRAVHRLMFVGKSLGAGRQQATLLKVLPAGIEVLPYTFDAVFRGELVSRRNWTDTKVGPARVWGEYLRMRIYGARGDIVDSAPRCDGLEAFVTPYLGSVAP